MHIQRRPFFYGWYFRCQSETDTIAVIPAVHISGEKSSSSIQILTEQGVWNMEFPISEFKLSRKQMKMQIEKNCFSEKGIRLDIERAGIKIKGRLDFGPFAKPAFDIMGPFCCIPGMECRHSVYSMEHSVNGTIQIQGKDIRFSDARGYMEGDSGTSFPETYVWTQHFFRDGSLVFAAADIPILGVHFKGTIGIVRQKDKECRFATYLGASVVKMGENVLKIRQGRKTVLIRLREKEGSMLHAPCSGKMTRKICEYPSCQADYIFFCGKKKEKEILAARAAVEYEVKKKHNPA